MIFLLLYGSKGKYKSLHNNTLNRTLIYFLFHTYEYNPQNKQERNK